MSGSNNISAVVALLVVSIILTIIVVPTIIQTEFNEPLPDAEISRPSSNTSIKKVFFEDENVTCFLFVGGLSCLEGER